MRGQKDIKEAIQDKAIMGGEQHKEQRDRRGQEKGCRKRKKTLGKGVMRSTGRISYRSNDEVRSDLGWGSNDGARKNVDRTPMTEHEGIVNRAPTRAGDTRQPT